MKNFFFLLLLISAGCFASAQDTLSVDLDGDKRTDTVLLDRETARIICRLSTQDFKQLYSKNFDPAGDNSGIVATKNGFEIYINWMRAGYKNQFRYDANSKRIQLIGMSRYEFGNVANDGSGESSVNLLTHDYIGKWNYFDNSKEKLIALPVIKTKMNIRRTFLEDFSDASYSAFADLCSNLYSKAKEKALSKK